MSPEIAFGTVLKKIRQEKNFSQEKLAGECGLDRTFISLMERGLRQPSLKTIFKIASVLKTSSALIIKLTEELIVEDSKSRISG